MNSARIQAVVSKVINKLWIGQLFTIYTYPHQVLADLNVVPKGLVLLGTANGLLRVTAQAHLDVSAITGVYPTLAAYVYLDPLAIEPQDRMVIKDAAGSGWRVHGKPISSVLDNPTLTFRFIVSQLQSRPDGFA